MRGAPRYWFPQTLIRRDVLGRMLLVGAASAACERPCSPRCWDGFGESSPLRTSTSIHLSVHFFRDNEPTSSLAVWACVAPPSVMQHAVLLGRDSWMRFNTRSYRALPRRPHDNRVFGELTLSHHATSGVSAYLWETKFRIFSDHKALESIGKVRNHIAGRSSSSPRSIKRSSTAKESRTATPTSCPTCQSLPRNMTAVTRRVSTLLRMAVQTS